MAIILMQLSWTSQYRNLRDDVIFGWLPDVEGEKKSIYGRVRNGSAFKLDAYENTVFRALIFLTLTDIFPTIEVRFFKS